MVKLATFSKSVVQDKIAPFYFSGQNVFYLNNFSTDFRGDHTDPSVEVIKNAIESTRFEFIDIGESQKNNINEFTAVVNYYNPTLNSYKSEDESVFKNPLSHFLDLFGISAHAEHLLIVRNDASEDVDIYLIREEDDNLEEDLKLITNVLAEQYIFDPNSVNYAMRTISEGDDEYNLKVDDETRESIDEIVGKLRELNASGAFLKALPYLNSQIKNIKEEAKVELSYLYLTEDFRILLTGYDEIEVKMSHLTKSLYCLFLLKREIHLDELKNYKEELFLIYKHISYQEDFDRMEESVDKLLRNENNEVYTHFSRIKSAFCKVMTQQIAKNYYIVGGKGKPKRIDLDNELYNVELKNGTFEGSIFPPETLKMMRNFSKGK